MPWRLFGIGAATFVASQVFHIPFNLWLLNPLLDKFGLSLSVAQTGIGLVVVAIIYGLSAGVFEEGARYMVYRFWLKKDNERTWQSALMFGAGHGGTEAIIFGILAGVSLIRLIAFRDADLSTVFPADQLEIAKAQVEMYWSLPWYGALLGAFERAFAICFHLSATVLVLQSFRRRNILWLGAAIIWHTILDAVAVYAGQTWNIYITEALVGVVGILSIVLVFVLRDPPEAPIEPLPDIEVLSLADVEVTNVSLDSVEDSRYV